LSKKVLVKKPVISETQPTEILGGNNLIPGFPLGFPSLYSSFHQKFHACKNASKKVLVEKHP
jgi:hypothetical protein